MQDLLEACSNAFEPNRDRDYERERLYPMLTAPQLRLVLRAREAEIELLRKVIEELNNAFAREFKKKLSTCPIVTPCQATTTGVQPFASPSALSERGGDQGGGGGGRLDRHLSL